MGLQGCEARMAHPCSGAMWSCRGVRLTLLTPAQELQGCEAEGPETMEGDSLHFCFPSGFRFLSSKTEFGFSRYSKVPRTLSV